LKVLAFVYIIAEVVIFAIFFDKMFLTYISRRQWLLPRPPKRAGLITPKCQTMPCLTVVL